jgi:RNA polymerase subunit RPABC4/transcription elongation factor Spt4
VGSGSRPRCGHVFSLGHETMVTPASTDSNWRKCPFCRSIIPDNASVCPECHRVLKEQVQQPAQAAPVHANEPKCPCCGSVVPENVDVCPWCGAGLKEREVSDNQEGPSRESARERRCPHCGWFVPRTLDYCPNCGCSMPLEPEDEAHGPTPQTSASFVHRPFCRKLIVSGTDRCPQCGRPLRECGAVAGSATTAPTGTQTQASVETDHHDKRRRAWPGAVVALLLIILAVIFGVTQSRRASPGNATPPVAQVSQTEQTGTIFVSSEPSGAIVLLDGRYTDAKTPATLTEVVPGPHDVGVRLDGYDDVHAQVVVAAGGTSPFAATLIKSKVVIPVVPPVSKPAVQPPISTPSVQPATPKASPRPANGTVLKRLSAFRGGGGDAVDPHRQRCGCNSQAGEKW